MWPVPTWNLRHRSANRYKRLASYRKGYRRLKVWGEPTVEGWKLPRFRELRKQAWVKNGTTDFDHDARRIGCAGFPHAAGYRTAQLTR
jgi:hypothetical protein